MICETEMSKQHPNTIARAQAKSPFPESSSMTEPHAMTMRPLPPPRSIPETADSTHTLS